MNYNTGNLVQAEQDVLTSEVSDEALESAAGRRNAGAFTFGACTGLDCSSNG